MSHSVRPFCLHAGWNILTENRRVILMIDNPEVGVVAMMVVGGIAIDGIDINIREGQRVNQGDEIGYLFVYELFVSNFRHFFLFLIWLLANHDLLIFEVRFLRNTFLHVLNLNICPKIHRCNCIVLICRKWHYGNPALYLLRSINDLLQKIK